MYGTKVMNIILTLDIGYRIVYQVTITDGRKLLLFVPSVIKAKIAVIESHPIHYHGNRRLSFHGFNNYFLKYNKLKLVQTVTTLKVQ